MPVSSIYVHITKLLFFHWKFQSGGPKFSGPKFWWQSDVTVPLMLQVCWVETSALFLLLRVVVRQSWPLEASKVIHYFTSNTWKVHISIRILIGYHNVFCLQLMSPSPWNFASAFPNTHTYWMHGSIRILIPSNLTLHTTVESESKADKTRALHNT